VKPIQGLGRTPKEILRRARELFWDHSLKHLLETREPHLVHGMRHDPKEPVAAALAGRGNAIAKIHAAMHKKDYRSLLVRQWFLVWPALVLEGAQDSPYLTGDLLPSHRQDGFLGNKTAEQSNMHFVNRAKELMKMWNDASVWEANKWRAWKIKVRVRVRVIGEKTPGKKWKNLLLEGIKGSRSSATSLRGY
jgi:hypothetical protein